MRGIYRFIKMQTKRSVGRSMRVSYAVRGDPPRFTVYYTRGASATGARLQPLLRRQQPRAGKKAVARRRPWQIACRRRTPLRRWGTVRTALPAASVQPSGVSLSKKRKLTQAHSMQPVLVYLKPWEFSPTVLLACTLPAAAYTRGLLRMRRAREAVGFWRPLAYYLGIIGIYTVLQTRVDYVAAHMFWVHRLQHLILHHIAPFLLVLAAPLAVLRRGLPAPLETWVLRPLWRHRLVQAMYHFVQHPVVAPALFVGLVYFWLTPAVHFAAMLNNELYKLMNWSMALDGILFWWIMLAPLDQQGHARIGYLARILILFWVMVLQILPGAVIAMHETMLYDVYDICGRAWDIDPLTDQELGGLITWIPAAMMSVVGILIVLRHILHEKPHTAATPSAAAATK
jgi:putative membrane protein